MKTKLDILKILKENKTNWCKEDIQIYLKILKKFKNTDTLDVISKNFNSYNAFCWAREIGDREIMRDRVTDIYFIYCWVIDIGDKEIMMHRVKKSYDAYFWAFHIGDREVMIHLVTDCIDVRMWVRYMGDKEFFIKKGLIEE